MAWEIFSQADVETITGVAADDMEDDHYLATVDFAENWMGKRISGQNTYTAEEHDGDGTHTVFVLNPPIVSVSALSIFGSAQTSSVYEIYNTHIRLKSFFPLGTERVLSGGYPIFPIGSNNISITYVGGLLVGVVNAREVMGMELIVAQFAIAKGRGGSNASLAFDFAQTRQDGESDAPQLEAVQRIANTWLGKRVRAY